MKKIILNLFLILSLFTPLYAVVTTTALRGDQSLNIGRDLKNISVKSMTGDGVVLITYDILQVGAYNLTSGSLTLTMTNSAGINSIDASTMAANTWYYVYVIFNPSTATVASLGSLSSTAPTLPAGYTHKRRVGSFRATSTTVIRKFQEFSNGNIYYESAITALSTGTATTYTDVDCSTMLPPTSRIAFAQYIRPYDADGSSASCYLRAKGCTDGIIISLWTSGTLAYARLASAFPVDSSQIFQYYQEADDSSVDITLIGYQDNL
jgi:hypothetical protein